MASDTSVKSYHFVGAFCTQRSYKSHRFPRPREPVERRFVIFRPLALFEHNSTYRNSKQSVSISVTLHRLSNCAPGPFNRVHLNANWFIRRIPKCPIQSGNLTATWTTPLERERTGPVYIYIRTLLIPARGRTRILSVVQRRRMILERICRQNLARFLKHQIIVSIVIEWREERNSLTENARLNIQIQGTKCRVYLLKTCIFLKSTHGDKSSDMWRCCAKWNRREVGVKNLANNETSDCSLRNAFLVEPKEILVWPNKFLRDFWRMKFLPATAKRLWNTPRSFNSCHWTRTKRRSHSRKMSLSLWWTQLQTLYNINNFPFSRTNWNLFCDDSHGRY